MLQNNCSIFSHYFCILFFFLCVNFLFISSNFLDPPHPWWSSYSIHETSVSSCCSFSFASLISSFSSSLSLTARSCVITTLLNGLTASLILFKFRNTSHFFVSSSIAISIGLSLFYVAFPNLTAFLTSLLVISIFQMFLHSPAIFWISSSLLVSGSGLSDSGSPKTIIFFLLFCLSLSSISLSFSDFWISSSTFVLVPVS